MKKPFKVITLYTHGEQVVNIQPTPEYDGIEISFYNDEDRKTGKILYIDNNDLPEFTEAMNSMMDYIITKK